MQCSAVLCSALSISSHPIQCNKRFIAAVFCTVVFYCGLRLDYFLLTHSSPQTLTHQDIRTQAHTYTFYIHDNMTWILREMLPVWQMVALQRTCCRQWAYSVKVSFVQYGVYLCDGLYSSDLLTKDCFYSYSGSLTSLQMELSMWALWNIFTDTSLTSSYKNHKIGRWLKTHKTTHRVRLQNDIYDIWYICCFKHVVNVATRWFGLKCVYVTSVFVFLHEILSVCNNF